MLAARRRSASSIRHLAPSTAMMRARVGGRPLKMSLEKVARARELMAAGELNADEVAATLKVARRTLFRGLANARAHDQLIDKVQEVQRESRQTPTARPQT